MAWIPVHVPANMLTGSSAIVSFFYVINHFLERPVWWRGTIEVNRQYIDQ